MKSDKRLWLLGLIGMAFMVVAAACGGDEATPIVVEKEVVKVVEVEKLVPVEVVKEVIRTVEVEKPVVVEVIKEVVKIVEVEKPVIVEKIVEVVSTPTPLPPVTKRIEELTVAQIGNPVALDCWNYTSVDEADILYHFAEPLFAFDRQNQLHGVVAESWEMVSPTEWLIRIRKGLKFHDPEYGELKAEDVVASLDACYNEEGISITRIPAPMVDRQVEILDPYTIRITLAEPGTAVLPNAYADAFMTSKRYLELVGLTGFTRRPMGTGPLKFVEWVPNVRIVGERFEDYWGGDIGVERVVWRIITDAFTRKSELLTGGIDILPFLVPEVVPEVEANPDVRVVTVFSSRYLFVVLPIRHPPYDDQRVRQALNYAVNKQEIVDTLFRGIGALPLTGVVHPMLAEADPNRVGYPYDPVKARQLLDEARADGVEIGTINIFATSDRYTLDKETGEAVAGYWRAIGLDVEFFPESRTTLFPKLMGLQMEDPSQVGCGNLLARAEMCTALWLQGREDPRSRGQEYAVGFPLAWNTLINDLGLTVSGSAESIQQARALDELFTEYAPWVFLLNFVDLYGVSNDIDWMPYPLETRYFLDARLRE